MEVNKIKFRCSSLGHLMVEGKNTLTELQAQKIKEFESKEKITDKQKEELARLIQKRDNPELAETVITHLADVYVSNKYNRFTEINAKQLNKGNDVEEDSITIVSRITKEFYKKNEESLQNDFIMGTPDLFKGEHIRAAELIRDTKSSWDAYSFHRAKAKKLNYMYYCQGLGYMWLTGAKKCSIDYCLNNTPYHILEGELRKESFNHVGNDTPAWIELQIIANHVYDKKTFDLYIEQRGCTPIDSNAKAVIAGFIEIPFEERHFNFEFERNDDDIEAIKNKIIFCRQYIEKELFKKHSGSVI